MMPLLLKSTALVLAIHFCSGQRPADVSSERLNSWAQVTTWDLDAQSYAFSVCSSTLASMSFALRSFNASAEDATYARDQVEAEGILTNFLTPRRQLGHGDAVNPTRIIGGERVSRNDILHQIMIHHGTSEHDHHRRLVGSSECSGHGHICGASRKCHCDSGYIRGPGFQECLALPVVEECAEGDFTQIVFNVLKAGEHILYTDVLLTDVQAKIQNSNSAETLAFKACMYGCPDSNLNQEAAQQTPENLKSGTKWLYTIIGSLIVCTTALVGILVLLLRKSILMKLIDLMACFAAGTLLATVVLHLLPEASNYLKAEKDYVLGLSICAGVLVGIFVEQGLHMFLYAKGAGHGTCHGHGHENHVETSHEALTSPAHQLESQKTSEAPKTGFWDFAHVEAVAWVVAIGDFAHAFTDGILIAVAFSSSNPTTGWVITMAICLHEVPHRIGDFFIFLKAGMSIGQACFVNFLASLSSLIGALALLVVGDIPNTTLGVILGVGSGVLLFLAMSELMPPMLQEMKPKAAAINLLFFILGIFVIALSMATGGCSCGHDH